MKDRLKHVINQLYIRKNQALASEAVRVHLSAEVRLLRVFKHIIVCDMLERFMSERADLIRTSKPIRKQASQSWLAS